MPAIEIEATDVSLSDLLDDLCADESRWSILDFSWAIAADEDQLNVGAIEQKAAGSETGLQMSADELRELAQRLLQVVDGIFVAYAERPPARSLGDMRAVAMVAIEAFDGTFWRVYARDEALIDRIATRYGLRVRLVPEIPIPSRIKGADSRTSDPSPGSS